MKKRRICPRFDDAKYGEIYPADYGNTPEKSECKHNKLKKPCHIRIWDRQPASHYQQKRYKSRCINQKIAKKQPLSYVFFGCRNHLHSPPVTSLYVRNRGVMRYKNSIAYFLWEINGFPVNKRPGILPGLLKLCFFWCFGDVRRLCSIS